MTENMNSEFSQRLEELKNSLLRFKDSDLVKNMNDSDKEKFDLLIKDLVDLSDNKNNINDEDISNSILNSLKSIKNLLSH